jgi:F-type H+-transporting ATPase subunit delta
MPASIRVARRYARALFDVAVQQNRLEEVQQDLEDALQLWGNFPDLQKVMMGPVPIHRKQQIWRDILADKAGSLTLDFILLLTEKRRLDILPAIQEELQRLVDDYKGILRAYVETAVPLEPDLEEALVHRLSFITGKQVQIISEVNPDLIGGIIVRVEDRIYDGSVRGYLEGLRERLLSAPI